MKNLKYFPCERNRYFYGKLLGVEDFELEQKYMNDKRRLINRFMHGCGVVCGLNVVPAGSDAVSVEAGLALDFAGREIIVDEPVTGRLAEMEGFSVCTENEEHSRYLYLCIEYAEYDRHPVYSITGGGSAGEQMQHSRITEGYRIYLTDQEPEQGNSGSFAYYEEWKTLYWGCGIRISQVFPRYARSGSEFDMRIVVENMGQPQPVSFHYELTLDCIKKEKKQWMRVEFDEEKHERAGRYEIPVTLEAGNVTGVCGRAKLTDGSFFLKVGGSPIEAQVSIENTVELTDRPVQEIIERHYFAEAMREIKKETYHQSIYLAKISLFWAGSTVVIDDVEEMPFGQYICTDVLSGIRELAAGAEQKYLMRRLAKGGAKKVEPKAPDKVPEAPTTASGTAIIELGIGGLAGQCFFSKPIVHGLGPGEVSVVCGIADNASKPGVLCFGEPEVFWDGGGELAAKVAVKADIREGTFVIGLRLTEPTSAGRATVFWTAASGRRETWEEREGRSLFLKPDMVYLKLREDYYFEPVFTGVNDTRVCWSVTEQEGGCIDENGMYTAPSVPGIYEITARSAAHSELAATAFAVVRDIEKN